MAYRNDDKITLGAKLLSLTALFAYLSLIIKVVVWLYLSAGGTMYFLDNIANGLIVAVISVYGYVYLSTSSLFNHRLFWKILFAILVGLTFLAVIFS